MHSVHQNDRRIRTIFFFLPRVIGASPAHSVRCESLIPSVCRTCPWCQTTLWTMSRVRGPGWYHYPGTCPWCKTTLWTMSRVRGPGWYHCFQLVTIKHAAYWIELFTKHLTSPSPWLLFDQGPRMLGALYSGIARVVPWRHQLHTAFVYSHQIPWHNITNTKIIYENLNINVDLLNL